MAKTIVITGCTTGIGRETANSLAQDGNHLLLVSRSEDKLLALKNELQQRFPQAKVEYFVCDFEHLGQVSTLGKMIEKTYPRLDVLINNAGIWESRARSTEEGFEVTWAVNYFAPYILTATLMPLLKRTAKQYKESRIVNLSSEAHRFGKLDYNDFFRYSFRRTYGTTKLANLLHTIKLARELKIDGVSVHAVHPGVVATGLWRKLPRFVQSLLNRVLLTPEEGAKTTVHVAIAKNLPGTGLYWSNEKPAVPKQESLSIEEQDKLFQYTEQLLAKYL